MDVKSFENVLAPERQMKKNPPPNIKSEPRIFFPKTSYIPPKAIANRRNNIGSGVGKKTIVRAQAQTHDKTTINWAFVLGILPLTSGFLRRSRDFLSTSTSIYSFNTNPKI